MIVDKLYDMTSELGFDFPCVSIIHFRLLIPLIYNDGQVNISL